MYIFEKCLPLSYKRIMKSFQRNPRREYTAPEVEEVEIVTRWTNLATGTEVPAQINDYDDNAIFD